MALLLVMVLLAQGQASTESIYLAAYQTAREAYAQGGSAESLAPVRDAIAELERRGGSGRDPADIAQFVLRAAMAAAQSERDEMGLYLEHAVAAEHLALLGGDGGAPGLSAHEAAGELWLQVHRFDDARRAFELARARIGPTERITAGLARLDAVQPR